MLFSPPKICFLRIASGFCIKYKYDMFTRNSNPLELIFEEKSQKSLMSVEARGFISLVVRLAYNFAPIGWSVDSKFSHCTLANLYALLWWIRYYCGGYATTVVDTLRWVLCLMWWIRHTEAGYYAYVVGYYV